MKSLFLAAVSFAALGSIPAAAFAQDEPPAYHDAGPGPAPGMGDHMDRVDRPSGEWPLERRIDWLAGRLDRAAGGGWLSGNEIARGQGELNAIRHEHDRLRERDGGQLSPQDRSYLTQRIDELNHTLRWEGRNPPPPWAVG